MHDLFRHEALPYAGPPRFVPSCAAAIRDGMENDERVLVLACDEYLDDLRDELGADAEDVAFVALDEHGRNPNRVATLLHTFQAGGDEDRPSLGVVEIALSGRTRAAVEETRLADAVLNEPPLRRWPMSVVCLYDADGLDDEAALAMRRSHAVVRGQDTNVEFEPDFAAAIYATALEPAPSDAARLDVATPTLGPMRDFVRRNGSDYGIRADRIDDLVLAANEIVTNSLRHGGGRASMTMWFADGAVICEVHDHGYLADLLAGRFAPSPAASSGRGVWLANHLCDLVQIRSSRDTGTAVRMHVSR